MDLKSSAIASAIAAPATTTTATADAAFPVLRSLEDLLDAFETMLDRAGVTPPSASVVALAAAGSTIAASRTAIHFPADVHPLPLLSIILGTIEARAIDALKAAKDAGSGVSYKAFTGGGFVSTKPKFFIASLTPDSSAAANSDGKRDAAPTQLCGEMFPIGDDVWALHRRFVDEIRSAVPIGDTNSSATAASSSGSGVRLVDTRRVVKAVAAYIWKKLSKSNTRDVLHCQTLYSFLTGSNRRLDCFGIASAVLAGCHVLGFRHVHLCLSEDHAWLGWTEVDAKTNLPVHETAEVSRAESVGEAKANAAKQKKKSAAAAAAAGDDDGTGGTAAPLSCGDPIDPAQSKSWLYLSGHYVSASAPGEGIACLVSNINATTSAAGAKTPTDSHSVMTVKRALLWLLYQCGALNRLPFALDELADLEESFAGVPVPRVGDPVSLLLRNAASNGGEALCLRLFRQSIAVSESMYGDRFIYPRAMHANALTRLAEGNSGVYFDPTRLDADPTTALWFDAIRAYGGAARVASQYSFSGADSLMLKEVEAGSKYLVTCAEWLASGGGTRTAAADAAASAAVSTDGKSKSSSAVRGKRKAVPDVFATAALPPEHVTAANEFLARQRDHFFVLALEYYDHVFAWDERSHAAVGSNFIEPLIKVLGLLPAETRAAALRPERPERNGGGGLAAAAAAGDAKDRKSVDSQYWPFPLRSVRFRKLLPAIARPALKKEVFRLGLQHSAGAASATNGNAAATAGGGATATSAPAPSDSTNGRKRVKK